jgi:hypothetical protein
MRCPHCDSELTEPQVKRLWSDLTRSKRRHRRGGPKSPVWRKHSEKAGSRCRCEKCNTLRARRNH